MGRRGRGMLQVDYRQYRLAGKIQRKKKSFTFNMFLFFSPFASKLQDTERLPPTAASICSNKKIEEVEEKSEFASNYFVEKKRS